MRKTVHCYCNLQNAIENYPYKFLDSNRDSSSGKMIIRWKLGNHSRSSQFYNCDGTEF